MTILNIPASITANQVLWIALGFLQKFWFFCSVNPFIRGHVHWTSRGQWFAKHCSLRWLGEKILVIFQRCNKLCHKNDPIINLLILTASWKTNILEKKLTYHWSWQPTASQSTLVTSLSLIIYNSNNQTNKPESQQVSWNIRLFAIFKRLPC